MRVDDVEADRKAVERSTHAIDTFHRAFMKEVVEARQALDLLVDFDRSRE